MGRRLIVLGAIVLFSVFAMAGSALAAFDEIFMTDAYGNNNKAADEVTVFGWNVQPWLYLNLPSDALTFTISWWNPVGTSTFYNDYELSPSGDDEVWHTLTNWSDSGGPRQLGDWTVRADYSSAAGTYSDSVGFTVTPEPISSFLFVIGGISLLGVGYRKKVSL